MARFLGIIFSFVFITSAFAAPKCTGPDSRRIVWTRSINPKTLPTGVEIVDRVWLRNPTTTEFITYTFEKGAAKRTNYRKDLGEVPTTDDELPGTKLVNGERYEYHFPANPDYSSGAVKQSGWVHQDYPAGLVEPATPQLEEKITDRIFQGRLKDHAVKFPVRYYFGKKRGSLDLVYIFTKNPKYGTVDPACK